MRAAVSDHPANLPATTGPAQLPAKIDRRRGIKPAVRLACEYMTWGLDGQVLDMGAAAKAAGVSPQGLRKAMNRPDVRQHLQAERQAVRSALTASIPHRLHQLAHQDVNRNAAVQACRALESLPPDDPPGGVAARQTPGVTIIIAGDATIGATPPPTDAPTISVRPAPRDERPARMLHEPIFRPPR